MFAIRLKLRHGDVPSAAGHLVHTRAACRRGSVCIASEAKAMLRCPHCKQIITTERCGVRLPLMKAGIFDVIRQSGDIGVTTEELAYEIYRDRRRRPSKTTIKSHCWQINAYYLEETNWIITSEGDSGSSERRWYLRRRHVRRVA